jgi:tetratricopeptide (TPR) repeat protein
VKAEKVQEADLRKRVSDALRQENLEKAEALLVSLLSLDSKSPTTRRDLARLYFRTGDYEKALMHARLWREKDPTNLKSAILLARTLTVLARQSELKAIIPILLSHSETMNVAAEAAGVALGLAQDYCPEFRAKAIASLEKLLVVTIAQNDGTQSGRILRALSRYAGDDIFWRAYNSAAASRTLGIEEIAAEHLLRRQRCAEALAHLQRGNGSMAATYSDTLRTFALDSLDTVSGASRTAKAQENCKVDDSSLIDALKSAEVSEFVVFHTDHFEPWGMRFEEWQLARCENFARCIAQHDYTRKLTLFYRPDTPFLMRSDAEDSHALSVGSEPGAFGVVAPGRQPSQQRRITEAMAPLSEATDIEFHLHLHHEDLIPCAESWGEMPIQVARHIPKKFHNNLLEFHVRANLNQLARDTSVHLEQWATIHGRWALNGSDRNVCTIDDELSRLQRLGCWGDFTFPAGRYHCTPRWNEPFSLRPTTASKAYDRLNADVRALSHTSRDMFWEQGRFFIWSMPVPYAAASLDGSRSNTTSEYYDVSTALLSWISQGIRVNGALIIKTHAHSMAVERTNNGEYVFPHFEPRNQRLFATLERICERADVSLRYAKVSEIKQRLTS